MAHSFKNIPDFLKFLKESEVQYVDFIFADLRGKQQHTAQHITAIDEGLLTEGIYFDGSSLAGWKSINESDMLLLPDLAKVSLDPFSAQPTVKVFCDVFDPLTRKPSTRCPRSIAKSAETYLQTTGI
ncbi:MAG: glutamine synthetase beta-grasp domain-containing protein, partial [Pseudomonadota bacterium]